MDPTELRDFERQPAFGVYPPEKAVDCHTCKGSGKLVEKDPLPTDIQKIRDKWARLQVNLGAIWRIIRKGQDIYQETNVIYPDQPRQLTPRHKAQEYYNKKFLSSLSPYMKGLVKKIRNDKRTLGQKKRDYEILRAHCGEIAVKASRGFAQAVRRKDPPLSQVPLPDPRRRKRGRQTEVAGPATYLIAEIVKTAGLKSKKGPKEDRFYWIEIGSLLQFYYPWEANLTKNHLISFYNHHKKAGIPSAWPSLKKLLESPKKK